MSKRFRYMSPSVGLAICLLVSTTWAAPEVPGAPQSEPIALVGATVHPVSGAEMSEATVLFAEGRIVAVGHDVTLPEGTRQIDATGKHVYPGLIDPHTQLGLVEIAAVRASRDEAETGQINPNTRALVAVNPDSELIPVARAGGVLTALTVPVGGLISGTSALINLDGWTYEDMAVVDEVALHVNWPRMIPQQSWWTSESSQRQMEERDKRLVELRDAFAHARAYQQSRTSDEQQDDGSAGVDLRWEAMLPVLRGERPMIIAADEFEQIQAAVAFAVREKVRPIILGGYDAPRCADLLKQHQVPVIIDGVHRLPQRRSDPYDASFVLAERLRQLGIAFCIASSDRASKVFNLPAEAATAAAYGLPRLEALRAVTLYPAEILGVADRLGTLDVDKEATLIVADGEPLGAATRVEMAFIAGREVDLSNRHKRLWEKYKQRYQRQGIVQ